MNKRNEPKQRNFWRPREKKQRGRRVIKGTKRRSLSEFTDKERGEEKTKVNHHQTPAAQKEGKVSSNLLKRGGERGDRKESVVFGEEITTSCQVQ